MNALYAIGIAMRIREFIELIFYCLQYSQNILFFFWLRMSDCDLAREEFVNAQLFTLTESLSSLGSNIEVADFVETKRNMVSSKYCCRQNSSLRSSNSLIFKREFPLFDHTNDLN